MVQQPERRAWGGRFVRLLSTGVLAMVLSAASCDDPLTKIHPGPVRFRVSIGKNLAQSNGASTNPSISRDGRYVVFASDAKNLALPSSNFREIFLRDRQTDTVINVTRLANAKDQFKLGDCDFPFISPNGDWVVFLSRGDLRETGNPWPPFGVPTSPIPFTVFRWNRVTDIFDAVLDWPDADVTSATISDDGRYVTYQTAATNMPGGGGSQQVYVSDFTTFAVTLVSVSTGTTNPCNNTCSDPTISANGQFIVFSSTATDLTSDVIPANTEQIFGAALTGVDWATSFSMELVSLDDSLSPAPADNGCVKPNISGDGRYISFVYGGGSLVTGGPPPTVPQVIRRDRTAGTTVNAGVAPFALANGLFFPFVLSLGTDISDDGRFVSAWYPINDNTGQPVDLFVQVQDLQEGKTIVASVGIIGSTAATLNNLPGQALSGDGRWVVFPSLSDDQIIGDNNRVMDIIGFGSMR